MNYIISVDSLDLSCVTFDIEEVQEAPSEYTSIVSESDYNFYYKGIKVDYKNINNTIAYYVMEQLKLESSSRELSFSSNNLLRYSNK